MNKIKGAKRGCNETTEKFKTKRKWRKRIKTNSHTLTPHTVWPGPVTARAKSKNQIKKSKMFWARTISFLSIKKYI